MRILLLDNYDSFTYNLLHYLQNTGVDVEVVRNDALTNNQMLLEGYDAAVLSPGPCTPNEAGSLRGFIAANVGLKNMLGICLGMQAIGMHFGWKLKKANQPVHGKTSNLEHSGRGVFKGISNPFVCGRYHSLVVEDPRNSALQTEAWVEGEVMAFSNVHKRIWGFQFHPESILTPEGQRLIDNWVQFVKTTK